MPPKLHVILFCILVGVATPHALGKELTEETVKKAMGKAVEFLYSQQNSEGHWDTVGKTAEAHGKRGPDITQVLNFGGKTALVLNALAVCGQQNEQRFQRGLEWLMKQPLAGTYALGLRLELIERLDDHQGKYRQIAARDVKLLLDGAKAAPAGAIWNYQAGINKNYATPKATGDYSNTNYAVLGLWSADESGAEIPSQVWRAIEASYVGSQLKDGGWPYFHPRQDGSAKPRNTMTAAAIASLYLVLDRHHLRRAGLGAHRKTPAYKAVHGGIKWMTANWRLDYVELGGGKHDYHAYLHYNLERVAKATGMKYFGTHDWFREIAGKLVTEQHGDGALSQGMGNKTISTALELLFLAKGSAPVVINKLSHQGDWDNYLTELGVFTAWLEKATESPANWQVTDIAASAIDWTDARMLYIAGANSLEFSDENKAKLKTYVEMGGTLVFHPDDTRRDAFLKSVQDLLTNLWPELELQNVEDKQDPLLTIHHQLDSRRYPMQKLASPVRTLAIIIEGRPAASWQRRSLVTGREAFELLGNLHYYVTDKSAVRDLPTKLTLFGGIFNAPKPHGDRTIARIKHPESAFAWNPEPLAWDRFQRWLGQNKKPGLDIQILAPEALPDSGLKVAHFTGSRAVRFTPSQSEAIKTWLHGGGTLIVDQAGGVGRHGSFDAAFTTWVEQTFGEDAFKRLSAQAPPLSNLGEISYRNSRGRRRVRMAPEVQAVFIDGRPALLYSRYDITCGLLGNPNPLVSGVEDEDACRLMDALISIAK